MLVFMFPLLSHIRKVSSQRMCSWPGCVTHQLDCPVGHAPSWALISGRRERVPGHLYLTTFPPPVNTVHQSKFGTYVITCLLVWHPECPGSLTVLSDSEDTDLHPNAHSLKMIRTEMDHTEILSIPAPSTLLPTAKMAIGKLQKLNEIYPPTLPLGMFLLIHKMIEL